jgi:hypothetical protein
MSLTTEIEKTKRESSLEKRCWSIQTGTPFGYWITTKVVKLGFRFGLYVWKAKT